MCRYSNVREIARMCGGFALGDSEVRTLNYSAVSDILLSLWVRNLRRKRTRYWATKSVSSIPSSCVRRCKFERGTLKIAPRHTWIFPLRVAAPAPSGSGIICAMCRILESTKICTYWMRCFRHRFRQRVSRQGFDLTCHPRPSERPWRTAVLVNLKTNMIISW